MPPRGLLSILGFGFQPLPLICHLMGPPEGATRGLWDGYHIGVRTGDPSCHQGVLGPYSEGHGASEEPGVRVLVDLGNQESGLEELDCLGFGPELPLGWSWRHPMGQVWVPPTDWAWGLPVDLASRPQFEIQAWRVECIESEEGGESLGQGNQCTAPARKGILNFEDAT